MNDSHNLFPPNEFWCTRFFDDRVTSKTRKVRLHGLVWRCVNYKTVPRDSHIAYVPP